MALGRASSTKRMLSSVTALEKYKEKQADETPKYRLSDELLILLVTQEGQTFFDFPFLRKLLVSAYQANVELESKLSARSITDRHLITIGTMMTGSSFYGANLTTRMSEIKNVDEPIPASLTTKRMGQSQTLHKHIKAIHTEVCQEESKIEASIRHVSFYAQIPLPVAGIVGDCLAVRVRR